MTNKIYGYLYRNMQTGRFFVFLTDGREHGLLTVGRSIEIIWNNRWLSSQLAYDKEFDIYFLEGFVNVNLPQGVDIRL